MFDRNLMRLNGMRGVIAALVLLALLQAGAVMGQAYALSSAVAALWEGSALEAALPRIAAVGACLAVLQLVRFAQETMLDRYSIARTAELRSELLGRTFDGKRLLGSRAGSTRVADALNERLREVAAYVRMMPPKAIGLAGVSLPLLVCLYAVDWPSGIICTAMFPVIMFFMVLLGRQARDRSERQYASYTRLTNRFMDTLRGLTVVKAFNATDREADSVYRHSEALRKATVRTLTTATLSSAVLDLCATFGVAAVAMMLAFRLLDGSIGLFTGLFALVLAPEFFSPVRSFAADYHASLDGKNALRDILDLIADEAERPDARQQARLSPAQSVAFKDVTFRYGPSGTGLDRVSFEASGPQKIAVIGRSGSGKSTLANLVAGFADPSDGEVVTCPVRYIPQKPSIFRATLADNMRFYNPSASRADVERAAAAVGLDRLVSELPDGLDTLVGDGARGLSGGQAHRVALARVLLDDSASVLVFDEPTAHLDIETELDLKEPMLALMEGKLVFLATHRLHWLDDVDRVIELDAGRIVRDEVTA